MSSSENQKYKKLVKKFNDTLNSLSSTIESSDQMISEHCELIRNQIDIRTESLIQEIEKNREILFIIVDDYEI
jgi:hypothetical protein